MPKPGQIAEFRQGPAATVARMNEIVRAVNANSGQLRGPRVSERDGLALPALTVFYVVAEFGDYLECVETSNVTGVLAGTETAARVYVAKPWLLRHSLATRVVAGDTQTYSVALNESTGVYERTATASDETTETQVVVPGWSAGDQILAVRRPAADPDVDEAPAWLEVSARAWAKQSA